MTSAPKFEEFLSASALNSANIVDFGEGVRAFVPLKPAPEPFVQAGPEYPMKAHRSNLAKISKARRSERDFTNKSLPLAAVEKVFSALAVDARRTYASAGGLYPIHTFGLLINTESPLNGSAVRYERSNHGLGVMASLPDPAMVHEACGLDAGIAPQMILIFVIYPDEIERKYGERAGRFAFIEVGHIAQQVSLTLAEARMKGYEIGGVQESLKTMLGLEHTTAQIAHGYALGI